VPDQSLEQAGEVEWNYDIGQHQQVENSGNGKWSMNWTFSGTYYLDFSIIYVFI